MNISEISKKLKEAKANFFNFFFPVLPKRRRHIKDFFLKAKNGTITGTADNDPSGIITYTQAGAIGNHSLLWVTLVSIPLLIAIEEATAILSIITKKGLGALLRDVFGKKIAIFAALIVLICNIITMGANLSFVSQIINLFTHLPENFIAFLFFLIFMLLLIRGSYSFLSRFLFALTPLFLSYIISAFLIKPNWGDVFYNTFNPLGAQAKNIWILAVALLGTTISPYLIFWQSTEEIEEKKTLKEIKDEKWGVRLGMIYCNLISFFIMIASAGALFGKYTGGIETAKDAALALKPLAGEFCFLLFSIGIIISGILSTPTLAASSAYGVADVFHWKEGLDKRVFQAKNFYLILLVSLFMSLVINFIQINPIKIIIYSQALNGFLVPFLIFLLLKLAFDKEVLKGYLFPLWIKICLIFSLMLFILIDLIFIISIL